MQKKNFFRLKIKGLQNLSKIAIALGAVGIFLCLGLALAKENPSLSLRPRSYAEGKRAKSERQKPVEEALIQYATPNWDTQLKVSGAVNPNSLPHMFNAEMTAQERGNLAAAIKERFKGDIYLVADEMLAGRRFWYSQDTGTLYFTRSAIAQIGTGNIAGLLNNIQGAINKGYAGYIEKIAAPRQVKPLKVTKIKPAEPITAATEETPVFAAPTASRKPAESPEPAAPSKSRTASAKRAMEALKSDLQALNRQAQKGATLRNSCRITQDTETRDEFTVWFDASDLRPGFTVIPFGAHRGIKQIPVIPHPHTFAADSPVRKMKRYQAAVSRDEVAESLEKENRTVAKLKKRIQDSETDIITKNMDKQKKEWVAETIGLMQTILGPCAGRVESARQRNPGEAGAILEHLSECYGNYLSFCHTLYSAKRKIDHSVQHGKAPAALVAEEFNTIIAAAAPWPRLQATLRVTKAGLTAVDLENWKFSSQYFGWNMAEAARTNDLSFMPQSISREILAQIYYDACRFVFLKRLELLQQKLQAADSADALTGVVVETHRLATLTYAIEWDANFSDRVKEKAGAYTSAQAIEASPAYFIGIMLLDAENHPIEIVSGAGSITPLEDLAAYQDYASIAQWHRPGCKIVFFVPTLTRFANFEQFTAYVEEWFLLQRMLPGSPEIWIGTISTEGKIAIYRPVAPNDQDLWDEVMTLIMQGMPSNQDLAAYLEREVYAPPSAADEAEAAQKRKTARGVAKMARSTEAVHPIYKVARNLPLFIQQGLSRSYTPELARDIMQFINLFFKKRFAWLREAKGVSIDIMHRQICITARRCQRYAMEYVTMTFVLDGTWFRGVQIEGLTDPIGVKTEEAAAPSATVRAADLEPKIGFAVRDLMRDVGKYPHIFSPEKLTAVEAFAGEWVMQRLTAGKKAPYRDFKIAWDEAQAQAKQAEELARQEADRVRQAQELAQRQAQEDAKILAELERLENLSPEQQTAQDLLTNKKFDRIRHEADPDTRQALELLRAIFEGRPYKGKEKPGRLARKLEHAAKDRGGVILEFYQKAAALAQNYPAMLERQLLSSVLRPRAAIDRLENDDLGYEILPLSDELMKRLSDPQMTIGGRILAIIEERKFKNPNEVRKESGLASGTFSHITRSNFVPHPRNLYAVAKVLWVDPILIVEGRPWDEVSKALDDKQKISLGRLRRGWSQKELAVQLELAGLNFNTGSLDAKRNAITQWERGVVPSPDTRPFIMRVLDDNSLFTQAVSRQPLPRPKKLAPAVKPELPPAPEPAIDHAKIQTLNKQAEALIGNRKFTDAEQLLLQALQLDTKNSYTLGNLAKVYLEMRNFGQSVEYADMALAIDPNDNYARRMRALAKINLKQYKEAQADLLQILDNNPKDVQAQAALDGIEYLKRGTVAASGQEIRQAVSTATHPQHIPGRMRRQEEMAHRTAASSVLRPRAFGEKAAATQTGRQNEKVIAAAWHDMRMEQPYELLSQLKDCLRRAQEDPERLFVFLSACEKFAGEFPKTPIETRYPILHAVSLLEGEEENQLIRLLRERGEDQLRQGSAIVDSIFLLHERRIPPDWVIKRAPNTEGRRAWDVSSEIWLAQGGLGRVQQFKDIPMHEFLRPTGGEVCTVEPGYKHRFDSDGNLVPIDEQYMESLPAPIHDIREIDRFKIQVHGKDVEIICKIGILENGMRAFFVEDAGGYYTKLAYNYNTSINPCTWDEFAEFLSRASLELISRMEERDLESKGKMWKPPIIHLEDSQPGLAAVYRKLSVLQSKGITPTPENMTRRVNVGRGDAEYVLGSAIIFESTHTILNREEKYPPTGQRTSNTWLSSLANWSIPRELAPLGQHLDKEAGRIEVGDVASIAMRAADRCQYVSKQQRAIVSRYDEWWFEKLNIPSSLTAVTNGDLRALTAAQFRSVMQEEFPTADIERPSWEQIYATKQKVKANTQLIKLNPHQPVLIYSGRFVPEKAGRQRALSDDNIRKLVAMGFQVVIYGNVQQTGESLRMEMAINQLNETLQKEQAGPGKLIFVSHFDQSQQRELLAASDILVLDSDPDTEAAGFTEVNGAACGVVVIAPPWREGILQAQGAKMDLDRLGKGNVLTPEIQIHPSNYRGLQKPYGYDQARCEQVAQSYGALYQTLFDKLSNNTRTAEVFLKNLAHYQAASVRLSRPLEARLTAAEQLRQYDMAIAEIEKEEKEGTLSKPNLDPSPILNSDLSPVPLNSDLMSSILRPQAFGEGESRLAIENLPGSEGRPQAVAEKVNPLVEKSLEDIIKSERPPFIILNLEDLLMPSDAVITEHVIDVIVSYIEAGGYLVFNTSMDKEWFYRRVLNRFVNKLYKENRSYLLNRVMYILEGGKAVYRYDTEFGVYSEIYTSTSSYKDMGDASLYLLASRRLKREALPLLLPDGSPAIRTLSDIEWLASRLRSHASFKPIPAPLPPVPESIAEWTFDKGPTFLVPTNARVKVVVGNPGEGAPGFIWADTGIRDGYYWKPNPRYLIPLIENLEGRHEALLPGGVNVFKFFWVGGSDFPWHWEGDFRIEYHAPATFVQRLTKLEMVNGIAGLGSKIREKIISTPLGIMVLKDVTGRASWFHHISNIDANLLLDFSDPYGNLSRNLMLNVFPNWTVEEFDKYEGILKSSKYNFPGLRGGSIGHLLMSFAYVDWEPAIVIEEIQTTEGFQRLARFYPEVARRYELYWVLAGMEYAAAIAKQLGVHHLYLMTNESAKIRGFHAAYMTQDRRMYLEPGKRLGPPQRHLVHFRDGTHELEMHSYPLQNARNLSALLEQGPHFSGLEIIGLEKENRRTYLDVVPHFTKPIPPEEIYLTFVYGDPSKRDRWQEQQAVWHTAKQAFRVQIPKGFIAGTFKVSHKYAYGSWIWTNNPGQDITRAYIENLPTIRLFLSPASLDALLSSVLRPLAIGEGESRVAIEEPGLYIVNGYNLYDHEHRFRTNGMKLREVVLSWDKELAGLVLRELERNNAQGLYIDPYITPDELRGFFRDRSSSGVYIRPFLSDKGKTLEFKSYRILENALDELSRPRARLSPHIPQDVENVTLVVEGLDAGRMDLAQRCGEVLKNRYLFSKIEPFHSIFKAAFDNNPRHRDALVYQLWPLLLSLDKDTVAKPLIKALGGMNDWYYLRLESILSLSVGNPPENIHDLIKACNDPEVLARAVKIIAELVKGPPGRYTRFFTFLKTRSDKKFEIAMHDLTNDELEKYRKEREKEGGDFWIGLTANLPEPHRRISVFGDTGVVKEGKVVVRDNSLDLEELVCLIEAYFLITDPPNLAGLADTNESIFTSFGPGLLEAMGNMFFIKGMNYLGGEAPSTTFHTISDTLLNPYAAAPDFGFHFGGELTEPLPIVLQPDYLFTRYKLEGLPRYHDPQQFLRAHRIEVKGGLTLGGKSIYGRLENGERVVIKVLHIPPTENISDMLELAREAELVAWINRNKEKVGLECRYPVPLRVGEGYLFRLEWLGELSNEYGQPPRISRNMKDYVAICYTAPEENFAYLDDPEQELYPEEYLRRAVRDISRLARHGIFLVGWAGYLHHEDRFNWSHPDGAGHMNNWIRNAYFTNYRVMDAADLGHSIARESFIDATQVSEGRFYLGNIPLSAVIIEAANMFKQQEYPNKFFHKEEREIFTEFLRGVYLDFYATYTETTYDPAEPHPLDRLIDWDNVADRLMYEVGFVIRPRGATHYEDLNLGGMFPCPELIRATYITTTLAMIEKSARDARKRKSLLSNSDISPASLDALLSSILRPRAAMEKTYQDRVFLTNCATLLPNFAAFWDVVLSTEPVQDTP